MFHIYFTIIALTKYYIFDFQFTGYINNIVC